MTALVAGIPSHAIASYDIYSRAPHPIVYLIITKAR